jgi:hypothetical protein
MEHSNKKLYKVISVTYSWLSVNVLCILFVNVCRHVVYGIVSCLHTLCLLLILRVRCVCLVSRKRLVGLQAGQVCVAVIVCYGLAARVD